MTNDTYPIYNGKNKLTFWSVFPYLVIIVLAFLLFKSCGKITQQPVVIKGKEIRDTIRLIDRERQYIADSFNAIIYKQDAEIRNYKSKYDDLVADYLNIQNETQNVITKTVYPDTCKPIVDLLTGKFNQLSIASSKKDKAASNTINSLTVQNKTKDKFLVAKDSSYKRLLRTCDTCSKALSELEQYAKKIKPKREINIGAEISSPYINLKPAVGLGIGYRDRKGNQINAAIYSNQTITVGYKRTLIKF